jgi:hypothetical protein
MRTHFVVALPKWLLQSLYTHVAKPMRHRKRFIGVLGLLDRIRGLSRGGFVWTQPLSRIAVSTIQFSVLSDGANTMRLPLFVFAACFLAMCGRSTAADPAAKLKPADLQFFENKIRPVLVAQCYECHSAKAQQNKKLEGKLLLDTREGIRKGGESGPSGGSRQGR